MGQISVFKRRGMWCVQQYGLSRPSAELPTWREAMAHAVRYSHLLARREERAMRRAGWK